MGLAGCSFTFEGDRDSDIYDNRENESNQLSTNQNNTQNDPPSQNDILGTIVPFKGVYKRGSSEVPLQKYANGTYKEGIFYFTHQNPSNLIFDPGYNAWLIQLPTRGKQVNVQRITRVGNTYRIYVHRRYDLKADESLKPSYGFFQVLDSQMPTNAKFRIYDIDIPGKPIWPR